MTFAGRILYYWDSDNSITYLCQNTKHHLNTFRVLKNKVNAPFVGPPKSKKFPNGIKVAYTSYITNMCTFITTLSSNVIVREPFLSFIHDF